MFFYKTIQFNLDDGVENTHVKLTFIDIFTNQPDAVILLYHLITI